MLVKREVFNILGLLDEGLMSFAECDDFCLAVNQSGGIIYYVPESIVTYIIPKDKFYLSSKTCSNCTVRISEEFAIVKI